MTNLALFILRATVGGLLTGHGAQKLFGWFGGHGYEGTSQWLESMNLRPGRQWAFLAGASEFAGGLLTVLGLLNPVGPLMAIGSMLMATVKVHAGRPIWVTSGGAELPVTNMAVQSALMVAGPGAISLDRLFGIRLPRWVGFLGLPAVVASVLWATSKSKVAETTAEQEAGAELQGDESERMEPAAAGDRTDEGQRGEEARTSEPEHDGELSAESEAQETVEQAEDNFEQAAAAMSGESGEAGQPNQA